MYMKTVNLLPYLCAALILTGCSADSSFNADNMKRAVTRSVLGDERRFDAGGKPPCHERAEAICLAVAEIDGVKEAYAAITGNTVIIGIVPADGFDVMCEKTLKRECERTAKLTDISIDHANVTLSPDLVERIKRYMYPR
jgi:YhcN/YlaJ family sporulation lipoprotein